MFVKKKKRKEFGNYFKSNNLSCVLWALFSRELNKKTLKFYIAAILTAALSKAEMAPRFHVVSVIIMTCHLQASRMQNIGLFINCF